MDNKALQIEISGTNYGKMIYVQGGTFRMGSDHFEWSLPIHDVTVDSFYIAETQVTQRLWKAVTGNNPSDQNYGYGIGDNLPVNNVSWNDVKNVFLPELNRLTGLKFRLPTESEWEFAARGGNQSKGCTYSGSNRSADVGWSERNARQPETGGLYGVHQVAQKRPNELGIYDMSGNVWEWCEDFFAPSYPPQHVINPTGPAEGTSRVWRGGSYHNNAVNLRVGHRCGNPPDYRAAFVGVRLAV